MITMTNVLKRGRTTWDRALLAEDEYYERSRVLREAMASEGLDVLVSLGHATRPGPFTYLSGYVPPLGWMGTVLTPEEGPVLISGGGSREIPFVRTQTWINDLRTSRSLFSGPAEVVGTCVESLADRGSRIGVAGAHDALNPVTRTELHEVLSAYEVVDADELMETVRAAKRPREVVALERSLAVAREAAAAAVARFEAGGSASEAVLAGEHLCRMRGSRDVGVLGDIGDGELAPVERLSDRRGSRFSVYCKVEYGGYWGQACASSAPSPAAAAAIDAMIDAAGVGVEARALAQAAVLTLPGGEHDVALSYGLGGGIGLDPSERPEIGLTATGVIPAGAVLALQAVTHEPDGLGCADATILVAPSGVTRL